MRLQDTDRLAECLRALPQHSLPGELAGRLRVTASRECSRRRRYTSLESWLTHCREELTLLANNLIRPFAVPFAGGLASALVLFAVIGSSYPIPHAGPHDVPTPFFSQATLQSSLTYNLSDMVMVVDVTIDEEGRVMDYSIPHGQSWAADPDMVRNVEKTLLVTRFHPATRFGQPASGRTRITLSRSTMDVRG